MTTLDSGFEDDLREAVLDDVEQTLRDDYGPAFKEVAAANWRAYASRHDYDIDHIWDDAEGPFIDRDGDSITMRVEWSECRRLTRFGRETPLDEAVNRGDTPIKIEICTTHPTELTRRTRRPGNGIPKLLHPGNSISQVYTAAGPMLPRYRPQPRPQDRRHTS